MDTCRIKGKRLIMLIIIVTLLAIIFSACAAVENALKEKEKAVIKTNGTFQDGITIEGTPLGGLTYSQAMQKMQDAEKKIEDSLSIEVDMGDFTGFLKSGDGFNISFNTEKVLDEAILADRINSAAQPDITREASAGEYAFKLPYTIDPSPVADKVKQWGASCHRAPVDATAVPLKKPDANQSKTGSSANPIKGQEGYFQYTEGQNGMELKQDELVAMLTEKLQKGDFTPVSAPFETIAPQVGIDQLKKITQQVSTFTTRFKGSPLDRASRMHNIAKAAGLINAQTIMPGVKFSINDILGPRTEAGGWKMAPGIENGQYTDQAGGGVCQVSTTLFNAVLMADIDTDTMNRSHHSWPSSYVDIGRDATISTGAPDFCFTNNKSTPIYVFTTVDMNEKYITVEIYGEPLREGLKIKITSKQLSSSPPKPAVEYQKDSTLPPKTIKEVRPAHNKRTSVTYKEYWQDGKMIKKIQIFSDTYKAFPRLILYSKDINPTASPSPS